MKKISTPLENYRKETKKSSLVFFLTVMFIIPLNAQNIYQSGSNVNIGILPVINKTNQNSFDPVSDQMGKNIFFLASELKRFSITNSLSMNLYNPSNTGELANIAARTNSHYLISGEITKDRDFYTFSLFLYNARTGKIEIQKNKEFYHIENAVELSFSEFFPFIRELTGKKIKHGYLNLINRTPEKDFEVRINGIKVGENINSIVLPEGDYVLKISPLSGYQGRSFTEEVEIDDDELERVRFTVSQNKVSEKNRFAKKNTIRIAPGCMAYMTYLPEDGKFHGDWPVFTLPEISYTRLINEKIGVNVEVGWLLPLFTFNVENTIGFEIKAGPCFRLGRVSLIPMVGYSMLFSSYDIDEYSLIDFSERNVPDSIYDYSSLLQAATVVLGFEFFFNPFSSIYGETGFIIGQKGTINSRYTNQYQSGLTVGAVFSIGTGISF